MKESFRTWLKEHGCPKGLICENNQTGIAVVQVLVEQGIVPGKDVSVICIDEVEEYLGGNIKLACWRLDHEGQFKMAVDLLCHEIEKPLEFKLKLVSRSHFFQVESLCTK